VKFLFDECVPLPLRDFFTNSEVKTAQEIGWGRLKNGQLLRKAEGIFNAFITSDQNLKYQQNLIGRQLAILQLPTNHWPTLQPHGAAIAERAKSLKPGDYVEMKLP
jgi:hypothetical protein